MNSFLEGILYKVNPNRFDQIRRTATGFSSNYVGSNIIQDDIFSLIENYARAKEMPLEWIRLPIDDQELCACTFIRGGRIFVMINTKLPYSKQIFAAAHELYHIWCYLEDNDTELIRSGSVLDARTIDAGTTEAEEMEANAFAGALLVPLDSLNQQMRIYRINSSDPGVDEILTLMDIFAVPYKAMVLRLVEENKISDEKAIDLLNISAEHIQKRISVTGKSKRWSLAPVGTEKLGSIIENLSDNIEAERLPDERLKSDGLKLEKITERYGIK